MKKAHYRAFLVRIFQLPEATKLMTADDPKACFRSRVVRICEPIIKDRCGYDCQVVIVKIKGYYPWLTNQWNEVIRDGEF